MKPSYRPCRCDSRRDSWRRRRASCRRATRRRSPSRAGDATATVAIARRDFVRLVRLSGTVEAVQSTTVAAPRLSGPSSNSLVVMRLIRPGHAGQARRPARRVRPPGPVEERARPPGRAQRSRAADPEEGSRGARGRARRTTARCSRRRARSAAPSSRWSRTRCSPKIQAEKNEQALEEAQAQAQAAQDDLRSQAAGGGGRPADPPDPARQGRERDAAGGDQRRRAWRSIRRSPGSRSSGRCGSPTPWRRSRKARRSAPASRSSTS